MKRFFATIGRFFWSWGFLKFVLAVIALIVLFYVEEDWRGARTWVATKTKWEAKGESFDYAKFIPPPVPDEQNLAALPLFKLETVKNDDGNSYVATVKLRHAMRDDLPNIEFPPTGAWQTGDLPDMAKIRKAISAIYSIADKGGKPTGDAMVQFHAIYPFFDDFLTAAVTRTFYRVNEDYTVQPPVARELGPLTEPIPLSKILTLHAILALDRHQPELALQDININFKLISGVKRDPTLVGGLVAIGVTAIDNAAIYDGLAQHAWSDVQLVELDQTLKQIDFLDGFRFSMRSELAQSLADIDFFEHASRSELIKMFGNSIFESPLIEMQEVPWPSGWWDQNKIRMASFDLHSLADVDPQARLVFPKVANDRGRQIEQANARWDAFAPWKILANTTAGPVTSGTSKFAHAQVWIDEARIACGLERHRLARGVYPGTLGKLAPGFIDEVPHDVMDGEAYHYRMNADGTFLLYSVGWNQVDDGGKVVLMENSKSIDYEKGDWVWPVPKYSR